VEIQGGDAASAGARRYLAARQNVNTGFGYGLGRRTEMLLGMLHRFAEPLPAKRIDIVDFGCADGSMLRAAARHLGERIGSGLGLDVFRSGLPAPAEHGETLGFRQVDLFKSYPYPLAASSCDVAIVSAFLKHHPDPARFCAEIARVLRDGGIAIVLDPRPLVVRIGMLFGRFNPRYNPSLWSRRSMASLLADTPLRIEHFERYWVAPNHTLHRMGLERWLPQPAIGLLGLHQCMVLRKAETAA